MSASSVRIEMLIAPVARLAAMKTGNMFELMAAKICDIGRVKLPDKQAQETCDTKELLVILNVQTARVLQGQLGRVVATHKKKCTRVRCKGRHLYMEPPKFYWTRAREIIVNVKRLAG